MTEKKKRVIEKKLLASFCILLFSLLLCRRAVFAEDYKEDRTGSITVILQQTDEKGAVTPFQNISVSLYKIGSVRSDMGAAYFDFDAPFTQAGIEITDTKTASQWIDAAKTLSGLLEGSGIAGDSRVSDENGKISYSDLAQGIYLLTATKSDSEVTMSPILLTVPFMEEGDWVYDIASYPKLSVKPAETPEETPKVTPKPSDKITTATTTKTEKTITNRSVKTGDRADMLLWSGIFIGAALILLILSALRKKKRS